MEELFSFCPAHQTALTHTHSFHHYLPRLISKSLVTYHWPIHRDCVFSFPVKNTNTECLGTSTPDQAGSTRVSWSPWTPPPTPSHPLPRPSRKHSKNNLFRSHGFLMVKVTLNLKKPWTTLSARSQPHASPIPRKARLHGWLRCLTEHGSVSSCLHLFQGQNSESQRLPVHL